jgi:predicted metal-dependent phosphoesterase TrpH
MKCDLHVHSIHSGKCNIPFLKGFCRESYSDPEQVYQALKRRGMDLVTLTDHDSIEGSERLRRHPDFFISEEVTCRMPSGTLVHIGVYDLTERQHIEIQRRRNDLASLLAYLSEVRLFFSVNHMFSALTGPRNLDDYGWFDEYFPAFEILNGQMLPFHNHQARQRADSQGKAGIAGSDAHVVASVAASYTEVPHARTASEFFHELRAGNGTTRGQGGSYLKLTRDILIIAAHMVRERPLTALLAPLAPLVPVVTLATLIHEAAFARRWVRCLHPASSGRLVGGLARPVNRVAERFA